MTVFRLTILALVSALSHNAPDGGALAGDRPGGLVSTDIGGTDPDDFQSMVHLLLYEDVLDIEGLVSSPPAPGRREHIHQVIDMYARDHANLRTHSAKYPSPDGLCTLAEQGAAGSVVRRGSVRRPRPRSCRSFR